MVEKIALATSHSNVGYDLMLYRSQYGKDDAHILTFCEEGKGADGAADSVVVATQGYSKWREGEGEGEDSGRGWSECIYATQALKTDGNNYHHPIIRTDAVRMRR